MTQQTVLKHTVKQGERWDNLAYYYYGNALEFAPVRSIAHWRDRIYSGVRH